MLASAYNFPKQRKIPTPLNVTGLIQGKVSPRSAPSTGFSIRAPKEATAKAIPNRTLTIATSASERTHKK